MYKTIRTVTTTWQIRKHLGPVSYGVALFSAQQQDILNAKDVNALARG